MKELLAEGNAHASRISASALFALPRGDGAASGDSSGESSGESSAESSGGGAGNGGPGGASGAASPLPDDIGDGQGDNIVERQIREAAMRESDPVLREKLWDEYRRVKGQE